MHRSSKRLGIALAGAATAAFTWRSEYSSAPWRLPWRSNLVYADDGDAMHEKERVENWSNTKSCVAKRIFRPKTMKELEETVAHANRNREKLRVFGSGLSPNGIGFSNGEYMLTLENMDQVLHVDMDKKQATIEAGALVGAVLEELSQYGLTLENLASINQQQLGGFTQVGAHGTGARIPPVEEQIVALELVTPGLGRIEISKEANPMLFDLLKCGLGCFGVVSKLTLQCVDKHLLAETTEVMTRRQVRTNHAENLRNNRHIRYMWIPYTDSVVVVKSNPVDISNVKPTIPPSSNENPLGPLQSLYETLEKESGNAKPNAEAMYGDPKNLNFAQFRDVLLQAGPGPLDAKHVRRVNEHEAEFWKRSQGVEIDSSDNVLAFECGGQQLVWEVAFPCGTIDEPDLNDLKFVEHLLEQIESQHIPAPAPIEQRWTCGSTAKMSPVYTKIDPKNSLHSWVGIIMYLPTRVPQERKQIEDRFHDYCQLVKQVDQAGQYKIRSHWAKIELPKQGDAQTLDHLRQQVKEYYEAQEFVDARKIFDPHNIMSNELIDKIFA